MKATLTIPPEDEGKRIDTLCGERFSDFSRSQWQKNGTFLREDTKKSPGTKVRAGDVWEVQCETAMVDLSQLVPWDSPLEVLAESASWVVIEKPYDVAVHPSPSDPDQQTIVNALVHQFGKALADNYDEIDGLKVPRPGLVHRLDKTTSGCLLVAKTPQTHTFFQEHWGEVEKLYTAIVPGIPPKKGRIEGNIVRDPQNRQKMAVSDEKSGKPALTTFEVEKSESGRSQLQVTLHTGRTHQIRVHLSSIGFPIVGDELYGGPSAQRVMLHARSLAFPDPDDGGKRVKVESQTPFHVSAKRTHSE